MKVLGGAVALGTAITIPFVIHDIISKSREKEKEDNNVKAGGSENIEIKCEAKVEEEIEPQYENYEGGGIIA